MSARAPADARGAGGAPGAVTHVLAVDQGTTNTKVVLYDLDLAVVARASRPVACSFPRPGWVEQDPDELWRSVTEAIDEVLAAHPRARPGLALTNQRESVVLWERDGGRALGPVVSWQCTRGEPLCAELRARGAERFVAERTGLPLRPMFSASKLRWLLDGVPRGHARARCGELCAGTIDSFLVARLTGGAAHLTDHGNAARTLLLDLRRAAWDPELRAMFGVPVEILPRLVPSASSPGAPLAHTRAIGGLPPGCPIVALAGDSHAALIGQGALAPGPVKVTYGTGSSLMTVVGGPLSSHHGLSATIAWSRPTPRPGFACTLAYALEGNIPVTGAALDWLARLLGLQAAAAPASGAAAVLALAATAPDTDGVHFVPALAGLGAPHWDSEARGLFCGLHRGTGPAHLARATVEAIAHQVADVLDAMAADTGAPATLLLADGGASRGDLLMQVQADLIGCPVERMDGSDGAALGVAALGLLALGALPDPEAIAALPRQRERFVPGLPEAIRRQRRADWRAAVARARARP